MMSSRRPLVRRRKGERVVSTYGGVGSGEVGAWLVLILAHGSWELAVVGGLLVWLCVVEELKYHAGAVNEVGMVLGLERVRTSSS